MSWGVPADRSPGLRLSLWGMVHGTWVIVWPFFFFELVCIPEQYVVHSWLTNLSYNPVWRTPYEPEDPL